VSWADLFAHWPLIQQDLHETYGIDTGDQQLMTGRSWFWLATRIRGLLNRPSGLNMTRIAAVLAITDETGDPDGARPR
jgi:hypothetical protein